MSDTHRICPACRNAIAIEDPFCPACGLDTQSELAPRAPTGLRARDTALPILLAAGAVVLRTGIALARNPWVQNLVKRAVGRSRPPAQAARTPDQSPDRSRRRIHIRSRWTVRDERGHRRQGAEEHIIDLS